MYNVCSRGRQHPVHPVHLFLLYSRSAHEAQASSLSRGGNSVSSFPTNGLNLNHGHDGVRQGIIIVATLVDKLPNLAGLARTCEVDMYHCIVVVARCKQPSRQDIISYISALLLWQDIRSHHVHDGLSSPAHNNTIQ
jgi:hypothetical protein